MYSIVFFVEQLTFFCRADDFFKKSVQQSRFEQLHFEQLTLTPRVTKISNFCRQWSGEDEGWQLREESRLLEEELLIKKLSLIKDILFKKRK
jgi:hypothetical protein